MRIEIRARHGSVSAETRQQVEQTTRLGLGRAAGSIEHARLTLGSGAHAGAPQLRSCRIRARVKDGSHFTTEGRAEHWSSAAGSAAWQLGQRVERHHEAERLRRPTRASAGWPRAGGERR